MKTDRITLHIGTLDQMGRRFAEAWKAAESGQDVERDHVTFLDLEAFLSAMSPKRLELMRVLRASGPMSVRALSAMLARDYKSVHQDAAVLRRSGLVERLSSSKIAVPWKKAVTELDLAA